jgi:hypothetical protein
VVDCLRKPRAIRISSVVDCRRKLGGRGVTGDGSLDEHVDDESGDFFDPRLSSVTFMKHIFNYHKYYSFNEWLTCIILTVDCLRDCLLLLLRLKRGSSSAAESGDRESLLAFLDQEDGSSLVPSSGERKGLMKVQRDQKTKRMSAINYPPSERNFNIIFRHESSAMNAYIVTVGKKSSL